MRSLEAQELKDLLLKCWMTHDAMWFLHSVQAVGIEKTNEINKAAVRAMAMIEIQRIKKALGIEEVQTFDNLRDLVLGAFELIKADFMRFAVDFPERNVMRWEMHRCFAYEGVTKLGVADQYRCGIFPRLEGWLDALGIGYEIVPPVDGCVMHTGGRCVREFRTALP